MPLGIFYGIRRTNNYFLFTFLSLSPISIYEASYFNANSLAIRFFQSALTVVSAEDIYRQEFRMTSSQCKLLPVTRWVWIYAYNPYRTQNNNHVFS